MSLLFGHVLKTSQTRSRVSHLKL